MLLPLMLALLLGLPVSFAGAAEEQAAAPAAVAPQSVIKDRLEKGKELFRKSDFGAAETVFEGVLRDDPKNPQPYYWLGQIYLKSGDTQRGVEFVRRSVDLAGDNTLLWLALGSAYEQINDQEAAVTAYLKSIELAPRNLDAALRLGKLYIKMGRDDDAFDVLSNLISEHARSRQTETAATLLKDLLTEWAKKYPAELDQDGKPSDEELATAIRRIKVLIAQNASDLVVPILDRLIIARPESPEVYYWLGRVRMNEKAFDEGLRLIRKSVELAPENIRLQSFLGSAYEEAGKEDEAEKIYQDMLKQVENPVIKQDVQRRYGMLAARRFSEEGKYDLAVQEYKKLSEIFPGDVGLLMLLVAGYEKIGKTADADKAFTAALAIKPNDAEIYLNMSLVHKARGDTAKADDFLRRAVALDKTGIIRQKALDSLGFQKGLKLLREKNLDAALDIFNLVLVVLPDDPLVHANIGEVYVLKEDLQKAEEAYKRSIELMPDNLEIRLRLARVYAKMEREDDALEMLEYIAAKGKGTAQGEDALAILLAMEKNIIKRGRRFLEKGDLAGAEKVFKSLLARSPDSAQGHYWLGQVNVKREKYDEGLADIEKSAALMPENVGIRLALGMAYEEAGMLLEAERTYLRVLEISPGDLGARLNLTNIYKKQGKEAEARAQMQFIAENTPADGKGRRDVLSSLGLAEGLASLAKDEPEQALESFNRVLEIVPDSLVYLNVGIAHQMLGNYEPAEEAFKKSLELIPDNVDARLKLGMLYSEMGRVDEAIDMLEPVARMTTVEQSKEATAEVKKLYNFWVAEKIEALTLDPEISDDEVRAVVDKSKRLVLVGMLEAAEPLLDIAYFHRPADAQVNYWLGQVAMKRKNYKDGLMYIRKSVELMPNNIHLVFKLADAYEEAGQGEKLKELWLQVVKDFPGRADVHLRLSETYEKSGEPELAKAELLKVVELEADGPSRKKAIDRLGFAKGVELFAASKWAEALESFAGVIEVVPGDIDSHVRMGDSYMQLKDLDAAEKSYKRVLELSPDNTSVMLKLAEAYMSLDRNDDALVMYESLESKKITSGVRRKVSHALDELYSLWSIDVIEQLNDDEKRQEIDGESLVARSKKLSLKGKYVLVKPVLDTYVEYNPEDVQANYWLGQAYLRENNVEQGLFYIRKSVDLAPDNHRLLEFYGAALESVGRPREAIKVYESVAKKSDDSKLVKSASKKRGKLLAKLYEQSGNTAAAEDVLKKLTTLLADDVSVWLLRGDLYVRLDRLSAAIKSYGQALALQNDNPDIHLRMANVYHLMKSRENEREALMNVVRHSKRGRVKSDALGRLGLNQVRSLMKEKDYSSAMKLLGAMKAVLPNESQVYMYMAEIYFAKRVIPQAEAMYKEAIRLDPANYPAQEGLGKLYIATKQDDKAIDVLEAAADLSINAPGLDAVVQLLVALYADRADKLRRSDKGDEAIANYKKLLERNPESSRSHYNLAVTYRAMQKNDEAIGEFKEVLKYSPDNYGAYINLARLYASQNMLDEAMESYAYAISLEKIPEKADEVVSDLAMILVRKLAGEKKTGHALRELFALRDRDPGKEGSHYFLGILFSQQGSLELAIKSYREVIRLNPKNNRVRFNLGILYERTSEYDLALDQYNAIVNSDETNMTVERARERLDVVLSRISPFSASMNYNNAVGESEINGVLDSSYNSTLGIRVNLNARPMKNLLLSVGESISYAANHTAQADSLASTINANANLNFENIFFSAGGGYSENHGLLVEEFRGNNINAFASTTIRYKNLFGFVEDLKDKDRVPPEGVDNIDRAKDAPTADGPEAEEEKEPPLTDQNDALRDALQALLDKELEEIKRHEVAKGDTLWAIAEKLLDDPYLWPELWYVNPNIENPHLIFPGDSISLVYIDGIPRLLLLREGQEYVPETMSVEEGLALFKQGVGHLSKNEYQQAIESFSKILEFVPDDLLTNLYIGIAYTGAGKYQQAEAALLKVLSIVPDHVMALYKLAWLYEKMARIEDAINAYQKVLDLVSDTFYARRSQDALTRLYRERALAAASGLARNPAAENIQRVFSYVDQLLETGDVVSAEDVLHEALKWIPENAEANYRLAEIYMDQDKYADALPYLHVCAAQQDVGSECLFMLANALEFTGDLEQAEQLYFRVLGMPDINEQRMWEVQYHLAIVRGKIFMEQGNYSAAVEEYAALMELFPGDVAVLMLAGEAYIQLGMIDHAVSIYEKIAEIDGENVGALLVLAELYMNKGLRDKAIATLKLIVLLEPEEDLMARLLRIIGFQEGLDLIQSGDYGEALEIFEAMREVAPDDALVLLNIGVIYQMMERYDEAEEIFLRVINKDPRNLTARMKLGLLYADMDRLAEAIYEIERVLSMGRGTDIEAKAESILEKLRLKEIEEQNQLDEGEPVSKTLSGRINYAEFISSGVSLFATSTYGASLSFTYPAGVWGNWSLSYGFSDVRNKHELGRDYAYLSNNYTLRVSRPILPSKIKGLSGGLSVSQTTTNYKNIDTHALYGLGLTMHRVNVENAVTANLSYRLHDNLSMSLNYSERVIDSNLSTGFVYTYAGIPVARQSATLSDYNTKNVSLGLNYRF